MPAPPLPQEAPALALLPVVLLVGGSLMLGVAPQWAADHLAWPAARALSASSVYIGAVLDPAALAATVPVELHREPAPQPTDWHHWLAPLLVVLGGGGLAVWVIRAQAVGSGQPLASLSNWLRRWHSGSVSDYALWTALATTLLMAWLATFR